MAENTLQFQWIVTIEGGLDALFRNREDVFVAGDLLWYPVQGEPTIRVAPDAMVVFGRPKGYRSSYKQWEEDNLPPRVVFEVLSPGNRHHEMVRKFEFYRRYEVQEYYVYDPDNIELIGYLRQGDELVEIPTIEGWQSPLLGVRFELARGELRIIGPDGRAFATYLELVVQRDQEHQSAELERQAREQAQQRAEAERQRAETEKQRAETEREGREKAERLAADQRAAAERLREQLQALGIEPRG